jgi:two-component SAPR family response regulator
VKIAILDDDMPSLEYYALVIKKIDNSIDYSLCSNEKFFKQALGLKPDLILADVNLGDKNVMEVFEKYYDLIGDIPVILMSCVDDVFGLGTLLRNEGVNVIETMQKPITPKMLKSVLV